MTAAETATATVAVTRADERNTGQGAEPLRDFAVVGCGPVGMTLAALLGKAGHSVVLLERYPGPYGLPRAASFDGEIMRALAGLGLADELLPTLYAQEAYEWRNGSGELLIRQECRAVGDSGWADIYMFDQPALENALHALCASLPNVDIRLGTTVVGLAQGSQQVEVETANGATFKARYVIGCDGGNSFVRQALGVEQGDLGFAEPWLVCDFALRRPAAELGLPRMLQLGDPAGPTTVITTGPQRQRFTFMLDDSTSDDSTSDGSPADDSMLDTPISDASISGVWERVRPYLDRADAELLRVATYTFRSLVARRWRVGRVLLAGDAAHQIPPFLGQGMCSGIRDALNIAFKADLLMRGIQGPDVLDTYQSEREPHVRAAMATSIELGRQHTLRDPVLAAERDARLLARRAALQEPDHIQLSDLGPGLLGRGGGGLSRQGRVGDGERTGLLDDIIGGGFRLLISEEALSTVDLGGLERAGVTVIGFGSAPAENIVIDSDGTHRQWLAELGAAAVAVRPDNYVLAAGPDAVAVAEELLAVLTPEADRAGT
ncbi:bifunctional 3-(3-hydroxy-phenyl)propionate/3-hydroxycinnamic acid hydroxylase [Streptomyces sp. NPDC057654]|uniref:bifunctional 3-(3-hydroxy-phenyl)propionate/3-hydroxycinnamic acid hydroxylase n=1 Tax=Streptomyces sp. NPDC057654 TaxID=3346196 RepID=UPI00369170C7